MFIKFNSQSNVNTNTNTSTTQRQPLATNQAGQSFYDIYAQQILKSGVAPIIQDNNTNATSEDTGYDDMAWLKTLQPPTLPQIQNLQGTSSTTKSDLTSLDLTSIFGLTLGKKMSYIDPQTDTVQEGVVKQVSLDENKIPYFELEDGTIVRLEKVNL